MSLVQYHSIDRIHHRLTFGFDIRITDMTGRLVDNFAYNTNEGTLEFGKNLNDGVYFVTAAQGAKTTMSRIIKTK